MAGGGSSVARSGVLVSRHPADHPLLCILFFFSSSFRLRSQSIRSFSAFSFPDKQQEQKRSFFSSHLTFIVILFAGSSTQILIMQGLNSGGSLSRLPRLPSPFSPFFYLFIYFFTTYRINWLHLLYTYLYSLGRLQ